MGCSHLAATLIGYTPAGAEMYRCDQCPHTFTIRPWAEAADSGFAPETDED